MTTISPSTTDTLLDLMPVLPGARKTPRPAGTEAGAGRSAWGVGWGLRNSLHRLRAARRRRARQRELEEAFERLSDTSAHLLADVGMVEEPRLAAPAFDLGWGRALPAPGVPPAGIPARMLRLEALSRSRRRLGELDDRLLADVALDRAQAQREARRPVWDAPANWLR
ncbi:MAG TPA: hypothetical protein VM899_17445 [Rubellimicrobium sp.]|jgi:uncharacterized protein YjiS (DUF1127 family)|nr:hypothetical protein [Rubellimicrobium sp.]